MNYFQLLSGCNSQALSIILNVAKQLLNLIQIAGPILLIISLGFTFIKLMQHPDDKKLISRLKNSALALILVFFIPLLVNVVMNMTDGSSQFSACWKENTNINLSPSYIEN